MNDFLELLASLLKVKDAKEWVETLIDDEGKLKGGSKKTVKDAVETLKKDFLEQGKTEGISEGKKQGEGRAERELKEQWEKDFAKTLGVDVAKVPVMIKAFKDKVQEDAKSKDITPNDALNHPAVLKKIVKLEKAYADKEAEYNTLAKSNQNKEFMSSFKDVLRPIFEKKYTGTEKAFEKALSEFVANNKFKKEGDVYFPIDENGKLIRTGESVDPITLVDKFEKEHLLDFFLPKEANPDVVPDPANPNPDPSKPNPTAVPTYTKDSFSKQAEWRKAISDAKSPEERSAVITASQEWETEQT